MADEPHPRALGAAARAGVMALALQNDAIELTHSTDAPRVLALYRETNKLWTRWTGLSIERHARIFFLATIEVAAKREAGRVDFVRDTFAQLYPELERRLERDHISDALDAWVAKRASPGKFVVLARIMKIAWKGTVPAVGAASLKTDWQTHAKSIRALLHEPLFGDR